MRQVRRAGENSITQLQFTASIGRGQHPEASQTEHCIQYQHASVVTRVCLWCSAEQWTIGACRVGCAVWSSRSLIGVMLERRARIVLLSAQGLAGSQIVDWIGG